MKIAITADDLDKIGGSSKYSKGNALKRFNKIKKAFNARFKTVQEIRDFLGKPENRWGNYKDVISEDKKVQAQQRAQFESYCCGWLQYYDEIVRKNCINHLIWFDWNGSSCTIYLYPRPRLWKDAKGSAPASLSSDPTNPTAPPPPYS